MLQAREETEEAMLRMLEDVVTRLQEEVRHVPAELLIHG